MKRRDFLSMTVATTAMAAAAGARPKARQDPTWRIHFVGGAYFTQVNSENAYFVVLPKGKPGAYNHRGFLVGHKELALPAGPTKQIYPAESYPLSVFHPKLGTAGNHSVYCLTQANVTVGSGAVPTMLADRIANYKTRLRNWTNPEEGWHKVMNAVGQRLSARFILRGGKIENGAPVNIECAKVRWAIEGTTNYQYLSDVARFESTGPLVVGRTTITPPPETDIYVFAGPSDSSSSTVGHPNITAHHPENLQYLYATGPKDSMNLKMVSEDKTLKVPYNLNITHPCDLPPPKGGGAATSGGKGANDVQKLIPPDTEFCVNEEGPPDPNP